jgi:hypothetical protein
MAAGKSPLTAPGGVTPWTISAVAKHQTAVFKIFITQILRHPGSGRGTPHRTIPQNRENGGSRRTTTELRRAPPSKEPRTCNTHHTGDTTSSRAPPVASPTDPTLYTTARRGSPALPPPKRPPEGERSGETMEARWIDGEISQIALLQ